MTDLDYGAFDVLTFDCYGTLIDWEKGIIDACRKEAEKDGFSFEERPFIERFFEVQAEIGRASCRERVSFLV